MQCCFTNSYKGTLSLLSSVFSFFLYLEFSSLGPWILDTSPCSQVQFCRLEKLGQPYLSSSGHSPFSHRYNLWLLCWCQVLLVFTLCSMIDAIFNWVHKNKYSRVVNSFWSYMLACLVLATSYSFQLFICRLILRRRIARS